MNVSNNTGLRPRLLILGDAVAPTGFSRVIHEIISPLCADFEVHQLGINYQGDAHPWPWTIYPARDSDSPFGFKRLSSLLEEIHPQLIFMLSDDVILAGWMHAIQQWPGRASARVVVYCPVDTGPLYAKQLLPIGQADRLFTFTTFARKTLTEYFAYKTKPDQQLPAIEIMPHGVSTSDFYPLLPGLHARLNPEKRNQVKRFLTGHEQPQLDDTFIVLNANRNQERKRLDMTIRGFARFAAGKPDSVKLYLHCGIKDLGWNIFDMAQREGISERLIVSTNEGGKPAFSKADLNKIYNACEIGINSSSSEGWGLVSFEHAATGAAQLVPGHTGCAELWTGHAELMEPALSITDLETLSEQYIIAPETVAAALEKLYCDADYYQKMCVAAYENATRNEYRWESISKRWAAVFEQELSYTRANPGAIL